MTIKADDWAPTLQDPEIQQYLFEEVGEAGLTMAAYLAENEPVSGVDILEAHVEEKPSAVRKILYALMEAHAAEYEKDTDAKGWETFSWRLDLMEIKYILRRRWADELLHLRKQLKFEEDHQFYWCTEKHRRMIFEDAMDIDFKCPVCQVAMQPADTSNVKGNLLERITELEPYFADST